jgi:hypothetical protein
MPTIEMRDTVAADAADVRITDAGYLVARPRVARTGIQLYNGSEIGLVGMTRPVRVYRPEAEVFSKDALHSFAHRPVTNDHPPQMVDSTNWRDYSVGQSGDEVVRDGEFVRVPMVVMDQGAIDAWKGGKAQLSVGYSADIELSDGVTPDGEKYDAVQKNIRANHIAIVGAARGGPKLRIGDAGAVHVNSAGVAHVRSLIRAGKVNRDAAWSFGASDENAALGPKGDDWAQYGGYFLAVDPSTDPETKAHYHYPVCKGGTVYRSGVVAAKDRAAQQGAAAVESAANSLLQQIDSSNHGDSDMTTNVVDIDGIKVEMSDIAQSVVQKRIKTLEDANKAAADKATADAASSKLALDAATKEATDAKAALATKDAENATLKKQLEDAKITPAKMDEAVRARAEVVGKAKSVLGDKLVSDGKTDGEVMRQVVDNKLGDTAKGWTDEQVKTSFATLTAGVKVDAASTDALATHLTSSHTRDVKDNSALYDAADKKLSERWKSKAAA